MRIYLLSIGLLAMIVSVHATSPLKPGAWEVSTVVTLPASARDLQTPNRTLVCFTTEYVGRNPYLAPESGPDNPKLRECKRTNYVRTGNTASWDDACKAEDDTLVSMSTTSSLTSETILRETSLTTSRQGVQISTFKSRSQGVYKGECSPGMVKIQ
jgi:Protein of unknown function (DUF3617)